MAVSQYEHAIGSELEGSQISSVFVESGIRTVCILGSS